MHHQSSQNTSSSSSGPSSNGQAGQYYNDPRSSYPSTYNQAAKTPAREVNSSGPQVYNGSNMQNQRNKFTSKAAAPITVNSNLDWSAANRAYNSPLILVPNSSLFGGIPQVSSFVTSPITGQTDQVNQFPYVPTGVYQNLGSMISGTYSPWPYVMNYDLQDNKQSAWSQADQKGAQNENGGSLQYYPTPFVPPLDGASLTGYSYPSMFPQVGPLSLPAYQMMKTTNGYVIQDLDALTQQDPAIPRAVPAMWTNPSELTLAKCLENREGITNVYIRGFLPETTDDMLHAYAVRFGKIERCKAIVDLDTGLCKGYVWLPNNRALIILTQRSIDSDLFSTTVSNPARTASEASSTWATKPVSLRSLATLASRTSKTEDPQIYIAPTFQSTGLKQYVEELEILIHGKE